MGAHQLVSEGHQRRHSPDEVIIGLADVGAVGVIGVDQHALHAGQILELAQLVVNEPVGPKQVVAW